jgi:hypothetical protein
MDFRVLKHPSLQIEVPQIIIHKTDQPDVVVHFFEAAGLSGKDLAEIDFLLIETLYLIFAPGKNSLEGQFNADWRQALPAQLSGRTRRW